MQSSSLIIQREKTMNMAARRTSILIDHQQVTTMSNGGAWAMHIESGYHTVEVMMGRKSLGVQQVLVSDGADITVRFTIGLSGVAVFSVSQIGGSAPAASPGAGGEIQAAQRGNRAFLMGLVLLIVLFTVAWIVLPSLRLVFHFTVTPG